MLDMAPSKYLTDIANGQYHPDISGRTIWAVLTGIQLISGISALYGEDHSHQQQGNISAREGAVGAEMVVDKSC